MTKNTKQNRIIRYEILLAVIIIACILVPQLIGTAIVNDEKSGLDNDGLPVTGKNFEDMEAPGTRFGVLTVKEWETAILNRFPDGEIVRYNSMADCYEGVEAGEIDAAMGFIDERRAVAETHPNLAYITEPYALIDFGFGTQKSERGKELCGELNAFLSDLKGSGEYDALRIKWEDQDRQGDVMDKYTFSGEKGTLRIATQGLWVPMSFYAGEKLTGEFIEIMNIFCSRNGYTPQYETVQLSAELAGLASGNYDVVADAVTISEERLETISITDPLMADEYYLVVKKESDVMEVPKAALFIKNLSDSFRRTFITEDRYKMLLNGLVVTIALSIVAGCFGTIFGAFFCFLRTRKNPFAQAAASLYIRIFRSIPVVVLLLVLNFIVFRNSGLDSFVVCAIAFSVEFGAYCSEIFRSGINAVPIGQARAAMALGFNKNRAFRKVILPQAMIHILPVYSGQFIATVKMTAIAGYISVIDLTKAADIIRSRTYEAFFPLFVTSVVYFFLCFILVKILQILETKVNPSGKKKKKEIREAISTFQPGSGTEVVIEGRGSTGMVLLKTEHLEKSFEDIKPLRDVNCEIRGGDVVSIIGPSGTGKSTLLNLIIRLTEPDGGSIFFEGEDTLAKGYDLNHMREKVGMVFQSFDLFSHLTIIENLMLAQIEIQKKNSIDAAFKSMELLHMVGLEDKALSLPSQLSGGQQQRVAIMRAVAMQPEMILFDEPTSALDPTMVGEVLAVIRKLAKEGLTMMIVTHEMRFARDVSTRVFYMDDGIIYEEGTPDQIFGSPKKEKTRQFINRLQVFETEICGSGFDMLNLITRIEHFGYRHMIDRKIVNHMQILVEELCIQTILPKLERSDKIRLIFEYDEADNGAVFMELCYPGKNQDLLENADPISQSLIRHACKNISKEYENGKWKIRGTIA